MYDDDDDDDDDVSFITTLLAEPVRKYSCSCGELSLEHMYSFMTALLAEPVRLHGSAVGQLTYSNSSLAGFTTTLLADLYANTAAPVQLHDYPTRRAYTLAWQ